ncbi:MAG TPA: hypothetical protein VGH81_13140 [Rudaea sp.]|jgi:hypothetical protein
MKIECNFELLSKAQRPRQEHAFEANFFKDLEWMMGGGGETAELAIFRAAETLIRRMHELAGAPEAAAPAIAEAYRVVSRRFLRPSGDNPS